MKVEVNIRPQCNELGYESESYAIVSVGFMETYYEFYQVIVEYVRTHGQIVRIDVSTNPTDYELAHPNDARRVGSIDVTPNCSGEEIDLALAAWLVTNPAAREIPFDIC